MKLKHALCCVPAIFLLVTPLALLHANPIDMYIKIPDIDGEAVENSTNKIDELYREIANVVQQRSGVSESEAAREKKRKKKRKKAAADITKLADQIAIESKKLEKLYKTPGTRGGKKRARALGDDAEQIKELGKQLDAAASPEEERHVYTRISERLRHKDRAVSSHKEWIVKKSASHTPEWTNLNSGDPGTTDSTASDLQHIVVLCATSKPDSKAFQKEWRRWVKKHYRPGTDVNATISEVLRRADEYRRQNGQPPRNKKGRKKMERIMHDEARPIINNMKA